MGRILKSLWFFVKRSTIHLDCFTQLSHVHNFHPIQSATHFYPEWWKNLPKVNKTDKSWVGEPTMKSCVGFIELFKNSVAIPMWSDLCISTDNEKKQFKWNFSDGQTKMNMHNTDQFKNFVNGSYAHLKIISPWLFKTKNYVKWNWQYATYNSNVPDELILLPGIVDYKYQVVTNINILINLCKTQTIFLNAGNPLVFLTPLSDHKVKIHNHLVESVEYEKIKSISHPSYFFNSYNKKKKMIQNEESKCPFRVL